MTPGTYGVVSDTHGVVPAEVLDLLDGVLGIFHAGDVCGEDVLVELAAVAPVYAVYGNNDTFPLVTRLPRLATYEVAGHRLLLVHELKKPEAPDRPVARVIAEERPRVVMFGHSHRPTAVELDGVLYLNPGSTTVRRAAGTTRGVAKLHLEPSELRWELIPLEDDPRARARKVDRMRMSSACGWSERSDSERRGGLGAKPHLK